jgi:hypothetical protein
MKSAGEWLPDACVRAPRRWRKQQLPLKKAGGVWLEPGPLESLKFPVTVRLQPALTNTTPMFRRSDGGLMRQLKWIGLAMIMFVPSLLHAGQIYGFIASANKAHIQVYCPGDQPGKPSGEGLTATDGSYRINVGRNGQCTLTLPEINGRPSATIFSYPNPVRYNFQLNRRPDGTYELRK